MTYRPGTLIRLIACAFVAFLLGGCGDKAAIPPSNATLPVPPAPPAVFAGSGTCGNCHPKEQSLWRGSHHELAMQAATPAAVLGNFNDARFDYAGVQSRFFKRGDAFMVRTDASNGSLQDFEIKYTFGVFPLQQYLIEVAPGRMQALSIFWDSRPAQQGGQRWAHLYPADHVKAGDPLHWTGGLQNWNSMCAACHSTDVRKNFDLSTNQYATTWKDINVACEACHGPASNHLQWAAAGKQQRTTKLPHRGFNADVGAAPAGSGPWAFLTSANPIATLTGAPRSADRMEVCSPCHSRRSQITEPAAQGAATFLDHYAPVVLEEGLYAPDGQIHDEVYEYGSFQQSRMFRHGVTCSDCHDPHSLKLRAAGNAVCAQCHRPAAFDTTAHHHHPAGEHAPLCADCHMPQRTYMVIDSRRDHSIRVPRPDLTVTHGVPNACGQCHEKKGAKWAADAVARWTGSRPRPMPPLLEAAGPSSAASKAAREGLVNFDLAPIVRASLASRLDGHADDSSVTALQSALHDPEALVRATALKSLQAVAPESRAALFSPLLEDSVRLVRIEAARGLADVPDATLSQRHQRARRSAQTELIEAELANQERPEAHLNLANYYGRQGDVAHAEQSLQVALRLDADFIPAYVNLAELYRVDGRDADGEPLLREAMRRAPDVAEPAHALGLLKARAGDMPAALQLLAKAARLRPDSARYGYVYAVALSSAQQPAAALRELKRVQKLAPDDESIRDALAAAELAL